MTSGLYHIALLCLFSIAPTSLHSFGHTTLGPTLSIEAAGKFSFLKSEKTTENPVPNTQIPALEPFVGSFDLVASQNFPNGNTRADTMSFYFGCEKTAIIIHAKGSQPDMRMVFHPSDASITALFEMKGQKGGYVLPMNDKYWPGIKHAKGQVEAKTSAQPTYTGETRTIEGYSCEKVLAESSDYKAEMWITKDIPLSMMQILSYQTVGAGKSQDELEQFGQFGVKGLPLQVNLSSKQGKAAVQLNLINFQDSVEDAIFSTQGDKLSNVE
ncbi:DUF4412 domain-containing protein [Cyclobacterium sp.]|uniref:DUF4412 domain-containing protein n=1 Tax=Cyclobacterium sp. TaxID=1966343 RepID=UPI0019B037AC|nr:DUF4412 domain-containing protein [Cyclobacterium sp.]MBD3630401.1 DUF4412 domain-containing protein [Cyclobacterium sp.]